MGEMISGIESGLRLIRERLRRAADVRLVQSSGFFDADWYLAKNPDIASAGMDPAVHYLQYGGLERRDPGPNFSSSWYLDAYADVGQAGINPLLHYLKYGRKERRRTKASQLEQVDCAYRCSVCNNGVKEFLPLGPYFVENLKRFGWPFSAYETETMNAKQYACPHCGASDRDRLTACYLQRRLSQDRRGVQLHLLDIAPSLPLGKFISQFPGIVRQTADLLVADEDIALDVTNMPEIETGSYDILICSHVLEHVKDDKKALAELYRVLKPGGWGIIMVPIILTIDAIDEDPEVTDVGERWRRFGQDDHVRLYSKPGFIERVESAGFGLRRLGMDYFGEAAFRESGISSRSVLYVVEKLA